MPHATAPALRVLHALKVKGFAEPPAIAESTGLAEAAILRGLGVLFPSSSPTEFQWRYALPGVLFLVARFAQRNRRLVPARRLMVAA